MARACAHACHKNDTNAFPQTTFLAVSKSRLITSSTRHLILTKEERTPTWVPLIHLFGDGPNMVSESTVSNTELSEFFLHRVRGGELSELLSGCYSCAKAAHRVVRRTHQSLLQNSVSPLLRTSTLETVFRLFPIYALLHEGQPCGRQMPCGHMCAVASSVAGSLPTSVKATGSRISDFPTESTEINVFKAFPEWILLKKFP